MATDKPVEAIEPLDGVDITQFIHAGESNTQRTILAEYLSETTTAPIYMLKKGDLKFISCADDPDLLFDLANDPNETTNLAADPSLAAQVLAFKEYIDSHWDNEALTKSIILSQKRRRLLSDANKLGQSAQWDHPDTAQHKSVQDDGPWYRGKQGYNQWAYEYTPVPEK